jgi:hypothetical protein
MAKMSATRIRAEALEILTAPGGPCDPFAGSANDPDLLVQIIKESLAFLSVKIPSRRGGRRKNWRMHSCFTWLSEGRQPRRDHSRHHNTKPRRSPGGFFLAQLPFRRSTATIFFQGRAKRGDRYCEVVQCD